jgi:phosphoenolpyruvate-protein kinase (PTS system EI component)
MEIVYSNIDNIFGKLYLSSELNGNNKADLSNSIIYIDNEKLFLLKTWQNIQPKCIIIDEKTIFSHLVSYSISLLIPVLCIEYEMIKQYIGKEVIIDLVTQTINEEKSIFEREIKHNKQNKLIENTNNIKLYPTIKSFENALLVNNLGIKDTGLICTEYFYQNNTINHVENNNIIENILEYFINGISCFRLYDNDDDKNFLNFSNEIPKNLRGIRAYKIPEIQKIIDNQIEILCEKSYKQEINIVIPYVTSTRDIQLVKNILSNYKNNIRLSASIETTSAFFEADELIKYGDSIFIGTNDLISSFFSYERNALNGDYDYCNPYSLSFWKFFILYPQTLVQNTIICGQLSLCPNLLELLISLGFSKFSVPVATIPLLNKRINNVNIINYDEMKDYIKKSKNSTFKNDLSDLFKNQEGRAQAFTQSSYY